MVDVDSQGRHLTSRKVVEIRDQDRRENNGSGVFEILKQEFGVFKLPNTRILVFWKGLKNVKADEDDGDVIHQLLRFSKRDEVWLTNL